MLVKTKNSYILVNSGSKKAKKEIYIKINFFFNFQKDGSNGFGFFGMSAENKNEFIGKVFQISIMIQEIFPPPP